MAFQFTFSASKEFHFAAAFAEYLAVPQEEGRIILPKEMGDGFIQEVSLNHGLSLCLHHYQLREDLLLQRLESGSNGILTVKFDATTFPGKEQGGAGQQLLFGNGGYAVEIGTSELFSELRLSAGQLVNLMVITCTRSVLLDTLQLQASENPITALLKTELPFILYENMTQEMERTLKQIGQIDRAAPLARLLYQTRAQDLIYALFNRFLTRAVGPSLPVNEADAKKIYELRSTILQDLSVVPQLPLLARTIGISETKMKQLFRQIFGDSIYNYYQTARMTEAAALLKKMSVSETGYQLGFSNLSHFSRLFEKHHQLKPKKFKALQE